MKACPSWAAHNWASALAQLWDHAGHRSIHSPIGMPLKQLACCNIDCEFFKMQDHFG